MYISTVTMFPPPQSMIRTGRLLMRAPLSKCQTILPSGSGHKTYSLVGADIVETFGLADYWMTICI